HPGLVRHPRVYGRGGADDLWQGYGRWISSGRNPRGANSQWCLARRPAGRSGHQVRTRRQCQSRESSRPYDSRILSRPRRRGDRMSTRRQFITLLGGAAAGWPLAARAQQSKLPTIGYLGANTPSAAPHWVAAFVQRLRELGWIDGRNLAIEYRWAEDRSERFAEIAAEFVRLKVDVILAHGTQGAIAAKHATAVTPIVATPISDPLRTGLVMNLARPGTNVTGLSLKNVDIAAKRIELLREGLPSHRRLAILANVSNPANVLEIGEVQVAARARGLEFASAEIRRAEEIAPAIEALISYGSDYIDHYRRAAGYVDRILNGKKPADLPLQAPTKSQLV